MHYFLIGNTMGYVRMIKAGGLHFVSNSIRFVPDLDDIPNFEQLTIEDGLQNDTIEEAAKTLDEVVANLVKNFSDSTEYFQVSREELLSFLVFPASVASLFFYTLTTVYIFCSSSWSTCLASSCMKISTRTSRISTSLSLPSPSITWNT